MWVKNDPKCLATQMNINIFLTTAKNMCHLVLNFCNMTIISAVLIAPGINCWFKDIKCDSLAALNTSLSFLVLLDTMCVCVKNFASSFLIYCAYPFSIKSWATSACAFNLLGLPASYHCPHLNDDNAAL